jgi:micrococcal nuclease
MRSNTFVYIYVPSALCLTFGRTSTTTITMRQTLTIIFLLTTFVCFGTTTKVTRIIDGDTFETETGENVRLIGINAPEISDIFGLESKKHLTDLIYGKTVDLQTDKISKDRDRYSRLLRYVILEGIDINKQMISDGFAFAYLKYQFENSNEYREAQLTATELNKGMWGNKKIDEEIEKQEYKQGAPHLVLTKENFIISVIVLLLLIGIYYYFRR